MAIIKQLYNKPLLEDGNPNKLPVYPISVASAIYDKYNTDLQTLIDEGYKYLGIATPTSPEVAPTPYQNCFYLAATEGTYSQFGGVTLEKYQLGIIKFTEGTWTLDVLARFYQIPATGIPFVDIESGVIPENTSDLINDSGFITNTVNNLINYYDKSSTYTKQEIQDLIGSSQGVSIKYVDTLPTASVDTLGSIYLVPAQEPKAANEKDEFITITTTTGYKWEIIGSTAISLDGYVTDTELTAALNDYVTISSLNTLLLNKQDKLVSGENIKTINGYSILGSGNLVIETASTPTWGTITGNIWNQSDLSTELNKAIVSVTTNEDGTIDFTKNNGDVTSVDLNHTHALADLIQDSTHRTVTDAEKASWNSSNIFIATTNTTLEELSDAYDEGKTLFFLDDGNFYVLSYSGDGDFYFSCFAVDENIAYYAYINDSDGWVLDNYSIPTEDYLSNYYQKPPTGIPESDLSSAVTTKLNATEIFWATYGVTTAAEIDAAIAAGKIVMCEYSQSNSVRCYAYSGNIYGSVSYNFRYLVSVVNDQAWYIRVRDDNNQWSGGAFVLQNSNVRLSSWQSTPDNSHYPSEKLVYDSLGEKQDIINADNKLDYSYLDNTPTIPDEVEANPTVPSGTTPSVLSGVKIGSSYYSVATGGGTVVDVTVGGTSVVNNGIAAVPAIPELVALSNNEIDAIIEEAEQ